MKCTMAILLSAFLGMSILGCQSKQAATNTTREQATAWIGYPQNAPDWQYRYVFDSPDMKSGWVEHKRDDGWFLSGPMEELKHNAASVTFNCTF